MPVNLKPSNSDFSAALATLSPMRMVALRRAHGVALACVAALVLSACTRTSEPTGATPSVASAPVAATGGDVVVWADAALQPLLDRALASFQTQHTRSVQVRYGNSAQLRQDLRGSSASAVQLYLGLAVPPPESDVLVVHPGEVKPQVLGLGDGPWSRTQWLWQDRMCSVSRIPVGPGTVMGQWQRKGVVLAGDFSGDVPSEPIAQVLVTAEGLQPGLRDTLMTKLRQWRAQNPAQNAAQNAAQNLASEAVLAVQKNLAHMALVPCVQGRTSALPAAVQLTTLSPALDVRLSYGMAVRQNAGDVAQQLAKHLQSGATQAMATQLGMTTPEQ